MARQPKFDPNAKREVEVPLEYQYISLSELSYITLEDAIKVLQGYQNTHAGKVITLKPGQHAYDDSGREDLFLYEKRLETDEEHADRLAKEAARLSEQESRERAEFNRLQAKFGK